MDPCSTWLHKEKLWIMICLIPAKRNRNICFWINQRFNLISSGRGIYPFVIRTELLYNMTSKSIGNLRKVKITICTDNPQIILPPYFHNCFSDYLPRFGVYVLSDLLAAGIPKQQIPSNLRRSALFHATNHSGHSYQIYPARIQSLF